MEYLSTERVLLIYELPLRNRLRLLRPAEVTHEGYASFDYDLAGFREGQLVRLDVLVGGRASRRALARSSTATRPTPGPGACRPAARGDPAPDVRRAVQAAIGSRIIARETIKAKRKDVIAKCYGGDISRKRKLLEKQKAGKRRMKQVGAVEVPQEAFLAVLNLDDGSKK